MGYPEWIHNLACHEIEKIRAFSQRESGVRGPVPRESVDCDIHFLASVLP